MSTPILTAAQRASLKAQAHALSPVVMIGDAGLTPNVVTEIERALSAHQLIKIRVLGDDRAERLTLLESICVSTGAAPVQQIGKLLIIWRARPDDAGKSVPARGAKKPAKAPAKAASPAKDAPRRNPISGRIMTTRAAPKKTAKGPSPHPPRTERVRKSGQKSTKKAFQGR